MKQLIIAAAVALSALVPAIAIAQTSTTGLLTVYVQVLNQTGVSYSQYQTYTPANFTVAVSGQSPSLGSFSGSQSGTAVTLNPGSYNVTITNAMTGYVPSYSVGCNGTIAAGGSQTCVVTMTPSYGYNQYQQYPYNYNNQYPQPLTCQTITPTVAIGQQASFNAVGGQGGTYNWSTAYQNYPNSGPTLTTSFQASGAQSVTVTNASQTAVCQVTVANSYYPTPISYPNAVTYPATTYPTYQTYPTTYPTNYQTYPATTYPTYNSVVYPQLPRTGFGPKDVATGAALAVVLLIAAGLVATPYVRKAASTLSR